MAEPLDFTAEERALFDRLNIGKAGGLPLPAFIRPSAVVAEARPLAEAIFRDWAALQRLVAGRETLLLDRWKSIKKRKRHDLVAAAWAAAADVLPDGSLAAAGETDAATAAVALPLPLRPDLVAWRRREREKGPQLRNASTSPGDGASLAAPQNLVALLDWTAADHAAFLWPHVSAEALALRGPRPLWRLAVSRAAHPPHAFAAADLDTTRLGKACLALLPRYLNQYSMLFSGRVTPDTYGQLYAWDELEVQKPQPEAPAAVSAKSGGGKDVASSDSTPGSDSFAARGTHPGEGLWILTIQARLYRFLTLAVRAILGHAVDGEDSSNRATDGSLGGTQTATAVIDDAEPLPDLLLQALEAPYCAPPTTVDLQALLDLTYAKFWQADDHVWALRTDPAYLAATLRDWAVHRKERLSSGAAAAASASDESIVTSAVVDACLRRALEQAETWHLVYAKARLLAQQMEKHADAVAAAQHAAQIGERAGSSCRGGGRSSGDGNINSAENVENTDPRLPREVLLSFYSLCYHIRSFENEPVSLLRAGAFASPPLRRHYRLEWMTERTNGATPPAVNANANSNANATVTAARAATTTPTQAVAARDGADGPPVVGDESGGHAGLSGTAHDAGNAAALAIWALTGLQDEATRQLFGRQTLLDELEMAVRVTREVAAVDVGMAPSTSSVPLSSWVADQVATLAVYVRCTALLDAFQPWAAAYDATVQQDTEIRDILTMDFHMSMGRLRALLEQPLGVQPPPFVNDGATNGRADTIFSSASPVVQLAAFWHGVRMALETHKALTPRMKEMFAQPIAAGTDRNTSGEAGNRTSVSRRAARVFRALFHDPAAVGDCKTNTPAAVSWPDVVHAMEAAGFVSQKLYTSAWLFVPRTTVVTSRTNGTDASSHTNGTNGTNGPNGSAATARQTSPAAQVRPSLFNEPWNSNSGAKLSPAAARVVGQRLNRAYGWDASTFAAE